MSKLHYSALDFIICAVAFGYFKKDCFRDLEVQNCHQLTDGGFNCLAKNCHELERMDLEDCSQITDQTLSQLATGCPNLINLVEIITRIIINL